MPTYRYRCALCGPVDLRHPMSEIDAPHTCPVCASPLHRLPSPVHHRWSASHRPGFETSGQRRLLDPEFQARKREELAARRERHTQREEDQASAQEE
jgi:putative FmdB family regulatory protein